jgi:lambda family phage tail tape measure protein
VSLFGKSGAELLGFLKEYSTEGLNAAYVTEEQAKAADDYADAHARMKSQFEQFLQVAAVNAIPILNDIADLFKDISKQQDGTSTSTEIVKTAMNGLVTVFQALVIFGSDVAFTFKTIGTEMGAAAAQAAAFARLDFKGAFSIGDEVARDTADARKKLDAFQARVMAIGETKAKPDLSGNFDDAAARATSRPKLNISGLNQDKTSKGKVDNSAAQEAKAQLAFDLDEIRKAQEALSNTISNSEKILDAKRSASLISESEYYAKKKEFLVENDRVQQAAAQKEIDRLQAEVLTGKGKIDNDRKIADAQAKLNKLRENATANLEILSIKEKDALGDIERAYKDAEAAAKSYLDVVSRAAQAEIAGVGKGQKARDRQASISQIEEKFAAQEQALQRDNRNGKFAGREEDYQRELALLRSSQAAEIAIYQAKYKKLDELQADWTNGATEALQNYYDESQNIAAQTEQVFSNAFKGIEDALVEFVTTGKLDFKSLVNSILADVARMAIKQSITGPLANLLSGVLGGSTGGGSGGGTDILGAFISGLGGRAIGGPVSAGGLYQVNEKGPELLTVGGSHLLMMGNQGGTVDANAGGGGAATVNVSINQSFASGTNRQTTDQAAQQASRAIQRAQRNA